MSRKLFVTDVDGVLLSFEEEVRKYFSTIYHYQLEPTHRWNFEEAFGIPKAEVKKMWNLIWGVRLKPFLGATRFLSSLQKQGFKVIALSSRNAGEAQEASSRDIILTGLNKFIDRLEFVDKGEKKGPVVRQWAAEYFLDDSIANVLDVANESQATKCFLMDRPYNTSQDIAPPYTRVKSFDHVLMEVF